MAEETTIGEVSLLLLNSRQMVSIPSYAQILLFMAETREAHMPEAKWLESGIDEDATEFMKLATNVRKRGIFEPLKK